jgi:DNA (cytosine-5)-methyltransferase 1
MPKIDIYAFFSGLGFLDLAFDEEPGFKVALASEFQEEYAKAYAYARKQMGIKSVTPIVGSSEEFLTGEKASILQSKIRESKSAGRKVVFIAGPPCPDFSIAGKNRGGSGENGRLTRVYIDLVLKFQPDAFVFENVKGLYRTKVHREFFEKMKGRIHDDYGATDEKLMNSLWFGAPQDRDRIILIGVKGRKTLKINWESQFKFLPETIASIPWPGAESFMEDGARSRPKEIPKELTAQHWFDTNKVTSHVNAIDFFKPRQGLKRFKAVDEGDDSRKSYKRLHRWRYSPTVAYGNNEVHLHPYKARRLTVSEALSLQGLPKEFCLPPDASLTDKFKMIGNGVPYQMGKGIVAYVKSVFKQ